MQHQRETPHVDVHHMIDGKNVEHKKYLPPDCGLSNAKKKFPLGDRLYEPLPKSKL